MSTLTSSSTLAEIEAAYDDSASYAEDRSPAKAKAFITACRMLIRRYVPDAAKGSTRTSLAARIDALKSEMAEARNWLMVHASLDSSAAADGVRHFCFDLEDWRNS